MEKVLQLRLVKLSEEDIRKYKKIDDKTLNEKCDIPRTKIVRNETQKRFECSVCFKTFSTKAHVIEHAMTHDLVKRSCPHCRVRILKRSIWEKHCASPILKTPQTCSTCSKIFLRDPCYKSHLKLHKIPCRFCGLKYEKLHKLKFHEEKCKTGSFGEKCGFCEKVLPMKCDLEDHVRIHHTNEKPFKCDVEGCAYTCKQKSDLFGHKSRNHEPNHKRMKECKECHRTFTSERALCKHFRIFHTGEKKHPHVCSVCDQKFAFRDDFIQHKETHSIFSCPKCNMVFKYYNSIHRHLITVHSTEKPIDCPMGCGEKFKLKTHLRRHIRSHTGEKPFQCKFCNKHFAREDSLKNHLLTHTGEEPFQCTQCSKKFVEKRKCLAHLKTHEENREFVSCPHCEQEYLDQSKWKKHMSALRLESPLICADCDKSFYTKPCFGNHLKINKHFVTCKSCQKKFTCLFEFEQHEKKHDNGTIGILGSVCPYCSKDLKFWSQLKIHLASHTGERPYECPQSNCASTFKTRDHMNKHVRATHTRRLKSFECEEPKCSKSFFTKNQLDQHKQIHTGQNDFAAMSVTQNSMQILN